MDVPAGLPDRQSFFSSLNRLQFSASPVLPAGVTHIQNRLRLISVSLKRFIRRSLATSASGDFLIVSITSSNLPARSAILPGCERGFHLSVQIEFGADHIATVVRKNLQDFFNGSRRGSLFTRASILTPNVVAMLCTCTTGYTRSGCARAGSIMMRIPLRSDSSRRSDTSSSLPSRTSSAMRSISEVLFT